LKVGVYDAVMLGPTLRPLGRSTDAWPFLIPNLES
jgi:hypothetical protein